MRSPHVRGGLHRSERLPQVRGISRMFHYPFHYHRIHSIPLSMFQYPFRFSVFFALHQYFARRHYQARTAEHLDFELTCDVIIDLWIQFHIWFGKFAYRAIEWRLNLGNMPSSLVDQRGRYHLRNRICNSPDPNAARVYSVS